MDFTKFWVIVVFVTFYEQFSVANSVNVLNKNHPGRSSPKRSADTQIYLAFPPDNAKTGKQESSPALIRLDPNAPNKFKGKFPTPIERFIQRIQNYFSVYNPPEYLNDLRPGIHNSENDGDQVENSNDTQIILPCNGTSTIVIIPVPLENEHVSATSVSGYLNTNPDKQDVYNAPSTPKPHYVSDVSMPAYFDTTTQIPICPGEVTTTKPKCPEGVTQKPSPYTERMTTPKYRCPEVSSPKPKCPEATTPKLVPCTEGTTTPKPKCPEANTPKPLCTEATTPKPLCTETTTTKPAPCTAGTTTPKPKCPEVTTPKSECPEVTTPKSNCPEVTTPGLGCLEVTTREQPCVEENAPLKDPKPISGYGPSEVPPLNLVAQPVLGSTVVYFYKKPSTLPPNSPYYFLPSSPSTAYEQQTRRPKPPILRLKQLLFPRLYAAFHPED